MNTFKNHGFSIELEREHSQAEDWYFGAASSPSLFEIPQNEREDYLPKGEVQKGVEDFMDCASRGPLNILETYFNYGMRNHKFSPENEAWLEDNGYITEDGYVELSDRYIAIRSGTTRSGNSLKAPINAIYEYGLIPKKLLPASKDMTFDDYHNPSSITSRMDNLGKEFKKRFKMNYEKVKEEDFEILYKYNLICLAGFAWPEPINGEYPHTTNTPNHVFVGIRTPLTYIFDNYIDSVDGDFIKKLARNFDYIDYGYRVFISRENQPEPDHWFDSLLKKILEFIKSLL